MSVKALNPPKAATLLTVKKCFRVCQGTIQTAILPSLAKSTLLGNYNGFFDILIKLVLINHSFGSAISAGAVATDTALADGLILTGKAPF
jgi:hypothetical protein